MQREAPAHPRAFICTVVYPPPAKPADHLELLIYVAFFDACA